MINNERIVVVNVYFPVDAETVYFIEKLQRIVNDFQGTHIVIAGDFNAHSPAWGGKNLDTRGSLLEEFFALNGLLIINNPYSPPTFTSSRSESWIDVAVFNDSSYSRITNWRVINDENLSEHAYIEYELTDSGDGDRPIFASRPKYALNQANWIGIKNYLEEHLIETYSEEPEVARIQLDSNIKAITKACEIYIPKKRINRRSAPWWTADLSKLRSIRRRLRKQYQRCHYDSTRRTHRKNYLQSQRTYKQVIEDIKTRSWREFCTRAS
ncbi:uncharacterized protein LOC111628912 [Centruroides sculpturatus]|uniref:uncharacterized protein LOC111628912 n=1 Tax=Centruroides sculpturatus TaxID=218467 RepID=UPI000C6CABB9|nr:uncharacterized protein LOC111628912 [Centruroides sculpturatus]